jgi:hypothetical protein
MTYADLLTKPQAGPKRTKFVRMLLHHYVWWGRGVDYDEFEGFRTSTCLSFESKLTMIFFFMISQWGIWVWWFPNVTQWGLGIFLLMPNEEDSIDSVLVCNPSGKEVPTLAWGEC